MLVMVVFFIAFRWIHLSTPLIRLFLLVLILLLIPTLNFLPVWFALSLLRFRLPSRLPMMFILWMVAMMVVIIPSIAAEGLTKRSAVGFLLRSLIMFQTFISRHNSNFFSDKLVLTSVTPASSAPVLQTPKAT